MRFSVLISANAEWKSVKTMFPSAQLETSPYDEYFFAEVGEHRTLFFHGGWGKVAAAGSTQFVIDRFQPEFLINLGTCGGIEGRIKRLDVVAAERAIIYDIHEAMGDSPAAIAHYTTELDVPAHLPQQIIRTTIYSADRDLTPAHLLELERRYRPQVVDWESGAIAWIAKQNKTCLLILRGVTDLVSVHSAEAEGNLELFQSNAGQVMQRLIGDLPGIMTALLHA
jgi:adenosylhomocysteine nucleosidase